MLAPLDDGRINTSTTLYQITVPCMFFLATILLEQIACGDLCCHLDIENRISLMDSSINNNAYNFVLKINKLDIINII
jgi:hypothetical protein